MLKKIGIVIFFILITLSLFCGCAKTGLNDKTDKITETGIKIGFGDGDVMPSEILTLSAEKNEFDIDNVGIDVCFGNHVSNIEDYYGRAYGYEKGNAVTLKLFVTNFLPNLPCPKRTLFENLVPEKEITDYYDAKTGKIKEKYNQNYKNIYENKLCEGEHIVVSPELFNEDYGKIYFTVAENLYNGNEFLTYGKHTGHFLYYIKNGNKITLYSKKPSGESKLSYPITVNLAKIAGYNVKEYNPTELKDLKTEIFNSYIIKKSNILYDSFPEKSIEEFSIAKALLITNAEQTESAYVLWFNDMNSALIGKFGMKIYQPSLTYRGSGKNNSYFGIIGTEDLINLIWYNSINSYS